MWRIEKDRMMKNVFKSGVEYMMGRKAWREGIKEAVICTRTKCKSSLTTHTSTWWKTLHLVQERILKAYKRMEILNSLELGG